MDPDLSGTGLELPDVPTGTGPGEGDRQWSSPGWDADTRPVRSHRRPEPVAPAVPGQPPYFPQPVRSGPGPEAAGIPPAPAPGGPPEPPSVQDSVYRLPDPWAPIVVDRPVHTFEPRPPSGPSYRPDTVFDGWSNAGLTVRSASVRGYAHRAGGRPREDDIAVAEHPPTGRLVFAVADGVSSAEQPHIGATLACRASVDALLLQLDTVTHPGEIDWQNMVKQTAWQLAVHAARVRGLDRPDAEEAGRLLATTLVAGVVEATPYGLYVTLVQVGDSAAWVLRDGRYDFPLGRDADDGRAVASAAVQPLPWVPQSVRVHGFELAEPEVLLVGTDGFGGPLGDGTGQVGQLLAGHLARPPAPRALAHLLDFSRETFDDDRTLLAVWRRSRLPEGSG
ncbi:protein phosphatase 2C domain-containing protein [Kitasatospora indigofera]|uniref:protein phosphatase 2C domain-containing protein n=1 Tax=Kitasatospora indigofera TaxID=67307 RepID=UPI00363E4EAF